MFSETAQATEAGAVIHGEPIHEVLVITEEAVTGPKQKKRKYIPDQVEGAALATTQVKQKSPGRPFKNSEGE